MGALHRLKIDEHFFDLVAMGQKPFEIRKNDRNYEIGDYLILYVEKKPRLRCTVQVTYIFGKRKAEKEYVKDGYVVLGIRLIGYDLSKVFNDWEE